MHFRVTANIATPSRSRRRSQFRSLLFLVSQHGIAYKTPSPRLLPILFPPYSPKMSLSGIAPAPFATPCIPADIDAGYFALASIGGKVVLVQGMSEKSLNPIRTLIIYSLQSVLCHSSICIDYRGREDFPTRVCQDVPFFRSENLASHRHLHTRDH